MKILSIINLVFCAIVIIFYGVCYLIRLKQKISDVEWDFIGKLYWFFIGIIGGVSTAILIAKV